MSAVEVNGAKVEEGYEDIVRRMGKGEYTECSQIDREEARALVGTYYDIQEYRKGASNKVRADEQGRDFVSPGRFRFLEGLRRDLKVLEARAKRGMEVYSMSSPLGRWCRSIPGVGEVVTSSLLAEIDFHVCCCKGYYGVPRHKRPKHDCPGLIYPGAVWRFAGMVDPEENPWERGQRRPYNARLKQTCYHLGEGFKKQAPSQVKAAMTDEELAQVLLDKYEANGHKPTARELVQSVRANREFLERKTVRLDGEEYLYTRLYLERKQRDRERNERGEYRDRATRMMERVSRLARKGPTAEQLASWKAGKLQPVGVDRRACRHAVCMFLAHFWEIGRRIHFGGKIAKPWVLEFGGHSRYIPPPNLHLVQEHFKP